MIKEDQKIKIREEGQILIESIVAITMILVSLLGVITLLMRSLHSTRDVGNRLIATHLAAEGIEIVKNLIDMDVARGNVWNYTVGSDFLWSVDYASNGLASYVAGDRLRFSSNLGYRYTLGTPTVFEREIQVTDERTNAMRVKSFARWREGSRNKEVYLEDVFYKWRK